MSSEPQGVVFDEAFHEGLEWQRPVEGMLLQPGMVTRWKSDRGFEFQIVEDEDVISEGPEFTDDDGWAWLIPQSHAEALERAEKAEAQVAALVRLCQAEHRVYSTSYQWKTFRAGLTSDRWMSVFGERDAASAAVRDLGIDLDAQEES